MMDFARPIRRIDVDDYERQVVQMVKEPVTDLGGYRMRLRDCQLRIDSDVQLSMQTMPKPASPHLRHLFDLRHMLSGVSDLRDDVRLGAVKHSEKDGFSAL